ncbi:WD40-repeat-containing domain protein [Xylaria sp. FL0064]|nr:WD40-repeat-containing domain protein [Xylaria sp. FL0064]
MYEKENGSCTYESTKPADGSTTVWAVAFSSTLEQNLLVAGYSNGDVVIYDTDSDEPRGSLDGVNAQTIAYSPDGRTLATADSQVNISLFDLQTLKFIYRLRFDTDAVGTKKLVFTSDNLRLLDIRGNDTISYSTIAQDVKYAAGEEGVAITAMTCVRDTSRVTCGKEDGTVHIYNIASESHSQELFAQTRNCAITLLYFDERNNVLLCADASGRVTSRKLIREAQGKWITDEMLFDKTNLSSITQIITSFKHSRLLISTLPSDAIWNLADANTADCVACVEGSSKQNWLTSPMNEDLLVQLNRDSATFYSWEFLTSIRSVELSPYEDVPLNIECVLTLQHPQHFVIVEAPIPSSPTSPTRVYRLWDIRDFVSKAGLPPIEEQGKIRPVLDFGRLGTQVETIVGVANEQAMFLDPDNWICSADVIAPGLVPGTAIASSSSIVANAVRHFFIPDEWVSLVNKVLIDAQPSGDIIFTNRTDLAVIRRGLEITDKGVFSGRRLSSVRSIPRRPADKRHITV